MTKLPDRLARLDELAHDLWWSWNQHAREVFRRLDYPLWRLTAHNPVRMLKLVSPEIIARAMNNPQWVDLYDRAIARLHEKGRRPRLIGIAFDCQQVPLVPNQWHDIMLSDMLTESGLRSFAPSPYMAR